MGLDDEAEKLRQAEQWLADGSDEQKQAAMDYVGEVLEYSQRADLRERAWAILHV